MMVTLSRIGVIVTTLVLWSCSSSPKVGTGTPTNSGWKVSKLSGSTVVFANGQSWDTKLISPQLLSEMSDIDGQPVLLVVGLACRDCDESPGLYLYRPRLGSAQSGSNQKRYSPPGSHFDSMDNQLKEKVRVFVGHCLSSQAPEIVWHGYRLKGGKWKEKYAHIVELQNDPFKEQAYVESVPDLGLIEEHVTKGECQELLMSSAKNSI
ncbi:MAG: hypothetical protein IT288_06160 [Bdellovibrionales bacterium]|nr:hypothetical protein [Bdellovibrionales bacterium]